MKPGSQFGPDPDNRQINSYLYHTHAEFNTKISSIILSSK